MDKSKLQVIDLEAFRELQADLGSYFISEPMFNIMVNLREKLQTNSDNNLQLANDLITIEDLLVYNDMQYHGSRQEKDMIQFMMFDKHSRGEVSLPEFEDFWKQFMYVYAEITHEPLAYSPHSSDLVSSTFDYITNLNANPNGRLK